jgi:DNA-binding GntR family transcriptional regulator
MFLVAQSSRNGRGPDDMSRIEGAISRSSEAYERIREDLIAGILLPGTKLAISDLQERYGLGAMPLREALNRLSAEQFVLKYDQRGFAVPPLDASEFLEIQNARIVIDTAALRETIASETRDWEDRLVLAYHHLTKASKLSPDFLLSAEWSHSHTAFHKELISGCKNNWLLMFADQLFKQSQRYRVRRRQIDADDPPRRENLLEEHRAIMDAAIEGDAETATARLIEHYRRSLETVLGEPVELCSSHLRFCRPQEK